MQYAANTASDRVVKLPIGVLPTATDFASTKSLTKGCVDVSARRYACTSTEESSSLRASASLRVKTSLCTRATILKDEETDGKVQVI